MMEPTHKIQSLAWRPDVVLVDGWVESNPRVEAVYIDNNRFHILFIMLYGIMEKD